jgi:arginine decarboxylase
MIPSKIFFTTGKGIHKEKLASFEAALREAKIEKFNLVFVSSIFPPNCDVISIEEGRKHLSPGQIVYCVLAKSQTNEPNRLIASAIGVAQTNRKSYGYLSEHHSHGETEEIAGEYAEDLAATMLATTIGIEFDSEKNYNDRKEIYQASGYEFNTEHYSISATGNKEGKWTTVISAAIFIK